MLDNVSELGAALERRKWPEHVPDDLALRLRDALSYNDCSQSDIWDEVKDWLEGNGVIAPLRMARAKDQGIFTPGGCTKYASLIDGAR